MANKFSQKTAVSLYKFDSEDIYRQWLVSNSSRTDEFHDIIAIVKNSDMNNGLDLFVNGHSLTKTRIYIKKGNDVVELTDSSNAINDNKQYIIKNFTRRGQGQKNILVLEEFDIPALIDSKFAQNIGNFAEQDLSSYVTRYIEEYFDSNPIKADEAKIKKFENILTNTHYIFRKIFSLLYRERSGHLGLELQFLDEDRHVLDPANTEYPVGKTIKYVKFRVSMASGTDTSFQSFKLYRNSKQILSVQNDITTGWNAEYPLDETLTTDTTYKAELKYKLMRIISPEEVNNIQNFDNEAIFKEKEETISATSKFYISYASVKPTSTKHKGYLFFVPTDYDEDGYIKLKSPYDTADGLETINWLVSHYETRPDIKRITFEYTKTGSNFEFSYTIPNQDANYQMYLMVPTNDTNTITSAPVGGFEDSISETCDIAQYNGIDYTLYKQSVAQESGYTFILKLKF